MVTRKKMTKKAAEKKARPKQTKTAQQVLDGMGDAAQGTFEGTKPKSYKQAMVCVELKDAREAAVRKYNRAVDLLGKVMTKEGTKVIQCGPCTYTREGKETLKLTGYKQKTDE